ncbi:uncharacterized protein LOC143911906 [Arctopsyche grandis]|uniref:uncharacterized protein LOC143911906 n=1 Tax=Arctopsyche grandis TaxID=121162 RepID=UPI00406D9FF4
MEQSTSVPKTHRHKKRQRQVRKRRKAANRKRNSQSTPQSQCESQNFDSAAAFWSNSFNGIISWQYQHQIAYWKSKATALSYENKVLHSIIRDLYKNKGNFPASNDRVRKHQNQHIKKRVEICNDEEESENYDIVLSEEMLAFLQKSAEHRLQRDQEKKSLQDKIEASKTAPPEEPFDKKRFTEMKSLYGSSADKIIGLETSLQLNFDQYVDSNNPVHWPNIPLVL